MFVLSTPKCLCTDDVIFMLVLSTGMYYVINVGIILLSLLFLYEFVKKTGMLNPVKSLGNMKYYNLNSTRVIKSLAIFSDRIVKRFLLQVG